MPRHNSSSSPAGWEAEFLTWAAPFLAALPRATQRQWACCYAEGLLGPSERKNIERLAAQVAVGEYDQLHHFLTTPAWDAAPLLTVLAQEADRLVGGPDAVLIVDDTTLLKKGTHSVGVAPQYSGAVGKLTNCQTLVSLTLAQHDVPVPIALRLFLPKSWAGDRARCRAAGVPPADCVHREKWQLALAELDRVLATGVRFGVVLADAAYGSCAAFRLGLSARGLTWAVGIRAYHQIYPATVRLTWRRRGGGTRKRPKPRSAPRKVRAVMHRLPWRSLCWRHGTKGPLTAQFAAVRVRVGDGPALENGWKVPGEEVWLVGERRADGREHFYLTNLPATASLRAIAQVIKARWACEQSHQQMKEELGLDHFEGRSWTGLHHHVLLTMISYAFLQHYRLSHRAPASSVSSVASRRSAAPAAAPARGKNPTRARRPTARAQPPGDSPLLPRRCVQSTTPPLPQLRRSYPTAA
jgi:SRSO17 transposase